jgi:hypothetical protein
MTGTMGRIAWKQYEILGEVEESGRNTCARLFFKKMRHNVAVFGVFGLYGAFLSSGRGCTG